jgi:hypothetical protein
MTQDSVVAISSIFVVLTLSNNVQAQSVDTLSIWEVATSRSMDQIFESGHRDRARFGFSFSAGLAVLPKVIDTSTIERLLIHTPEIEISLEEEVYLSKPYKRDTLWKVLQVAFITATGFDLVTFLKNRDHPDFLEVKRNRWLQNAPPTVAVAYKLSIGTLALFFLDKVREMAHNDWPTFKPVVDGVTLVLTGLLVSAGLKNESQP